MITFVDFKNAVLDAAMRSSNIREDGSVNWNFVEADLFIDGIMTEELRPAFNNIVDDFQKGEK